MGLQIVFPIQKNVATSGNNVCSSPMRPVEMNGYYRWKFTVLLGAILLLLAVRVTTSGIAPGQIAVDLFGVFFLIAAILTISDSQQFRRTAILLGVPAVLATFGAQLPMGSANGAILMASRGFSIAFLGLTIVLILRDLLLLRDVTWDSIVGTFCGYLLIGVMWSEAYSLLHLASPDSLHFDNASIADISIPGRHWQDIQYFSFATLTTVGYGDITPVSTSARTLAALEALCGQFYLAVLVAGLVGVRIPQHLALRGSRSDRDTTHPEG